MNQVNLYVSNIKPVQKIIILGLSRTECLLGEGQKGTRLKIGKIKNMWLPDLPGLSLINGLYKCSNCSLFEYSTFTKGIRKFDSINVDYSVIMRIFNELWCWILVDFHLSNT